MTNKTLEAALHYVSLKLAVFPLMEGQKRPLPGSHGVKDATVDPDVIRGWFEHNPERNIGIACGYASDQKQAWVDKHIWRPSIVVLDDDSAKHGAESWLDQFAGRLDDAIMVHTGGGGVQYWLSYDMHEGCGDELISNGVNDQIHIDWRSDGGYVVAPPSRLDDGGVYWFDESPDRSGSRFIVNGLPSKSNRLTGVNTSDIVDIYDAWRDATDASRKHKMQLSKSTRKMHDTFGGASNPTKKEIYSDPLVIGETISNGSRNDTLFRLAASLVSKGFDFDETLSLIDVVNDNIVHPPLPTNEVYTIARSAANRYEQGMRRWIDNGGDAAVEQFVRYVLVKFEHNPQMAYLLALTFCDEIIKHLISGEKLGRYMNHILSRYGREGVIKYD